jgi:hypothetical protein
MEPRQNGALLGGGNLTRLCLEVLLQFPNHAEIENDGGWIRPSASEALGGQSLALVAGGRLTALYIMSEWQL